MIKILFICHGNRQRRERNPGKTCICAEPQQPQGLGVFRVHGHFPVREGNPGNVHAALADRNLFQTHKELSETADRMPQHEL